MLKLLIIEMETDCAVYGRPLKPGETPPKGVEKVGLLEFLRDA